jgi:hypothetical protein
MGNKSGNAQEAVVFLVVRGSIRPQGYLTKQAGNGIVNMAPLGIAASALRSRYCV